MKVRKLKRVGLVAALMLSASSALAGDLKAPFDLDSTAVLPAGVGNPRMKNILMWVDGKYDGTGQVLPLGEALNSKVTLGDIYAANRDKETLLRGSVAADSNIQHKNDTDSLGATTGQVTSFAQVMVPVLGFGLTDKLTVAVAMPILKIQVNATTGFIPNSDGNAFMSMACNSDVSACNKANRDLADPVNKKLMDKGYEPIRSMDETHIGDAQLVSKYLLHKDPESALALKGAITFPTGRAPNPDRVVDTASGDGQYDLNLGVSADFWAVPELRWNVSGGYTAQLGDSRTMRIPNKAGDAISADKEVVRRNLGDQINLGTVFAYEFPGAGLTLGTGYNFQFLTRTTFQGDAYAAERYRYLEGLYPSQALHSASLSAGFSTVDWYKAHQFVLPFQANLTYSRPLTGRNVTSNDLLNAELVLFF